MNDDHNFSVQQALVWKFRFWINERLISGSSTGPVMWRRQFGQNAGTKSELSGLKFLHGKPNAPIRWRCKREAAKAKNLTVWHPPRQLGSQMKILNFRFTSALRSDLIERLDSGSMVIPSPEDDHHLSLLAG
ncbi:hypothetical protein L1887_61916 [Cichorium endivia]|nr:hypothetical protein L1887_61916 [Cichorium endivia]